MSQVIKWQEAQGVSIMTLICHLMSPPSPAPAERHTFISHLVPAASSALRTAQTPTPLARTPQPTVYLARFQLLLLLSLFSPRLSVPSTSASGFCAAVGHGRVIVLPGPRPLQKGQVGHEQVTRWGAAGGDQQRAGGRHPR